MIKRYHQLMVVGLIIEAAGCFALYKYFGWEAVVAIQAVIWGRQLTLVQNTKRKREQMPPNVYSF